MTIDITNQANPIRGKVNDIAESDSGDFTLQYGKGASFLRQIKNLLGYDTLRKSMNMYFSKYAWTST